MNIAYDEQAATISLALELVHDPHTVSEFEAHGKQSLDVHEAHYHFVTPPGVAIDAAALLASLQDAKLEVAGETDTQCPSANSMPPDPQCLSANSMPRRAQPH